MGPSVEIVPQSSRQASGHICSDCGESLDYTDEIWLLEVKTAQRLEGRIVYHNVIDEEDPNGDFLYEPFFFCFNCWDTLYRKVQTALRDELPVDDALSALECSCCGSGIREWEHVGVCSLGEFHPSKRAPDSVRGPHFELISNPEAICLYCLWIINNDHIDMWESLSQFSECQDCLQLRCWRSGTCGCSCHLEAPEEETQGDQE